jgi:hypothetical protein
VHPFEGRPLDGEVALSQEQVLGVTLLGKQNPHMGIAHEWLLLSSRNAEA